MNSDSNFKKIIKISGIILVFSFILIYGFLKSYNLLFGVKIKNVNIENQTTSTEQILKINGTAKNATVLTLNGRKITINKDGNFEEIVALLSGYNIINLKAEDKFGYKDDKNYQIMFQPLTETPPIEEND